MVKVTADNVNVYYVEWRDARRQQVAGHVVNPRGRRRDGRWMPKGPAAAGSGKGRTGGIDALRSACPW
jgi:hypothetical protein